MLELSDKKFKAIMIKMLRTEQMGMGWAFSLLLTCLHPILSDQVQFPVQILTPASCKCRFWESVMLAHVTEFLPHMWDPKPAEPLVHDSSPEGLQAWKSSSGEHWRWNHCLGESQACNFNPQEVWIWGFNSSGPGRLTIKPKGLFLSFNV